MTNVGIKLIKPKAKMPVKATSGAACYDAYLPETYHPLMPGENRVIPLGFNVELPEGWEMQIRARSGLAAKGIMVANGIGTVDSDYKGEVGVILFNCSAAIQPLNEGDRICQLRFAEVPRVSLYETDVVSFSERGEGGFGSTGMGATT